MAPLGLDKHQLAGLDDRERGFSRPVDVEQVEERYRAVLRYETVRETTELHSSQDQAMHSLITTLQAKGYRQLKSQHSFRNGAYLGSQELWVEYPDPAQPESTGLMARLINWFRPRAAQDE